MVMWYIVIGAFFGLTSFSKMQTQEDLKDNPEEAKLLVAFGICVFWPVFILFGLYLTVFGENER